MIVVEYMQMEECIIVYELKVILSDGDQATG